ncbi:MAG: HAD-IIIA family hydrolase [Armatimonadetes bacterium]|nr:HAD-IIIA family hydrolase [Armatimonadota bacterium]NCO92128.1 HAD-IIIA family hydrolase [Armatimonadota bacterium]NCP32465.1 HAD-IIIA family hydrolase [Armatimonadota bacterium]NCQ29648.1 HAD-IIIA family hydrolase [Armatimonadota bacterium]NDK15099.1 HAD-IIIA family hydrolase [Armatimonadota bacterium]
MPPCAHSQRCWARPASKCDNGFEGDSTLSRPDTLPGFRGVLLDRDGVLNDKPKGFVYTWEEFLFLPGVLEALRRLHEAGIPVAVITNQSFIGRGWISRDEVELIHQKMCDAVAEHGGRIEGVFLCPHAPEDGCRCRKPAILSFVRALTCLGLEASDCCYVGDRPTDVLAAHAAGMEGYLVRSGAAFDEAAVRNPPYCAEGLVGDLAEFVDCLLGAE